MQCITSPEHTTVGSICTGRFRDSGDDQVGQGQTGETQPRKIYKD